MKRGLSIEVLDDDTMCKSYSCRGESKFYFPLNFVPSLRPKDVELNPSPMKLDSKYLATLDDLESYNLLERGY